jgi:hypothetical protein
MGFLGFFKHGKASIVPGNVKTIAYFLRLLDKCGVVVTDCIFNLLSR